VYLDRLDEIGAELESTDEQRTLLEAAWKSEASSKD